MDGQAPQNAAPQAPVTPAAPVVAPVVPAGKPLSPKAKKLIITFSIIGVVVVALVVCAIIFLPMIFGVDWKEANNAAEDFYKANNSLSSDCSSMISYSSSSYVSDTDYEKYASKCSDAIDAYKKSAEAIGKTSAARNDSNVKEKWEAFKKVYEKVSPALDKIVPYMKDVHGFYKSVSDMDEDEMSESDVDDMVKPLLNSDNQAVKEFGEKFQSALKKYISAYKEYEAKRQAYYDASGADSSSAYSAYRTAYDAYSDAYDELYDLKSDASDTLSMENVLGVSEDELNDLDDKAEALYKEIKTQYRKNS